MARRRTKHEIEVDEAFMGGVLAALAIVRLHDNGVMWREIVDESCDPRKLRAFAKKEEVLELCGFDYYVDEYQTILMMNRGTR